MARLNLAERSVLRHVATVDGSQTELRLNVDHSTPPAGVGGSLCFPPGGRCVFVHPRSRYFAQPWPERICFGLFTKDASKPERRAGSTGQYTLSAVSLPPDSVVLYRPLLVEYFANFASQREWRVRLMQERDIRLENAVADDCIVGVSACVQNLHARILRT